MPVVEREIEFLSQDVICRGLFARPSAGSAPLIVLAHGLGGLYEMRLDTYVRRFAEAGYAALTFDYRFLGRSDGQPRHLISRKHQQRDIEAAIDFGRTLEGVDPSRVVLWGTSAAGGHMIDVTTRRSDIAATIIQGPFTDGFASLLAAPVRSSLGVSAYLFADMLSRLFGRGPVLVPLAAAPGRAAMMTKPDVLAGVLRLFPAGSRQSGSDQLSLLNAKQPVIFPSGTTLLNGVSASFAAEIIFWRPGKRIKTLRSPMFVAACEHDSVAPAKQTIEYARSSSLCELKIYPYTHFEIYVGDAFEVTLADQLEFLARKVPLRAATGLRQASASLLSE